jgi:hypothetical protein
MTAECPKSVSRKRPHPRKYFCCGATCEPGSTRRERDECALRRPAGPRIPRKDAQDAPFVGQVYLCPAPACVIPVVSRRGPQKKCVAPQEIPAGTTEGNSRRAAALLPSRHRPQGPDPPWPPALAWAATGHAGALGAGGAWAAATRPDVGDSRPGRCARGRELRLIPERRAGAARHGIGLGTVVGPGVVLPGPAGRGVYGRRT